MSSSYVGHLLNLSLLKKSKKGRFMHFLKIGVFLFFFVSFLKVFVGNYLWAMEDPDNTSATNPIHLTQKKNDDNLDEPITKNKASTENTTKPQNQIGKLTREECLKLKEIYPSPMKMPYKSK